MHATPVAAGSPSPAPRRLPTGLGVLLGIAAIVLGAWLVLHPLSSIRLLVTLVGVTLIFSGGLDLVNLGREGAGPRAWTALLAVLQILFGVVVLSVPGAMAYLPVLVAIVLLGSAGRDIVNGLRERRGRPANVISGAASAIFGILALAWPDISTLLIALLFGLWVILAGLRTIVDLIRAPKPGATRSVSRPRNLALAVLSLVVALALAGFGLRLTGPPVPDAFYTAPSNLPGEPGQLLRAEPFTRAMPANSKAWRILFTTTLKNGSPAVSSGLVIVPDSGEASATVAWAHGTTGVATGCAPSLQPDPLAAGAMPDVAEALQKGWGIVASDYVGLGTAGQHAYLVGEEAANSVLDAVRASRQLDGARFGDEVVIWGHSQGGGVSLWTGGVAPSYAPELAIKGVAAMAPASDLPGMMKALEGQQAETLVGPLLLFGMSAAYADVKVGDYIRPAALPIYNEVVARCWTSKDFIVNVLDVVLNKQSVWSQSPLEGALASRVAENVPTKPVPAPLLIAQGGADTLVLPDMQKAYVHGLCGAGQQLDFRVYEGKNHMSVVQPGSPLLPELVQWTQDRLDGKPATNTC